MGYVAGELVEFLLDGVGDVVEEVAEGVGGVAAVAGVEEVGADARCVELGLVSRSLDKVGRGAVRLEGGNLP